MEKIKQKSQCQGHVKKPGFQTSHIHPSVTKAVARDEGMGHVHQKQHPP